jgi:arsenite methyltransferase
MAEQELTADRIRERVRSDYGAIARHQPASGCGCGCGTENESEPAVLSLGCGNPTAVADLQEGEVVLDLGSGAGGDVLLSAQRVGPSGRVYGLDMTDEMLALARENAARAGVDNVEWLRGEIESVPLPGDSVDVVISNCVINLSADKPRVFREAARVLRPGGRFAVTDIVADEDMSEETRRDIAQWTGCIAGALTKREFEEELAAAGFADVEVRETHRVHEQAGSAIVRARTPLATVPSACSLQPDELTEQRARYAELARHVTAVERTGRRLVARLDHAVDEASLGELIAVERGCCPFFELDYAERDRRLSVSVPDAEHEPALDAIEEALTRA